MGNATELQPLPAGWRRGNLPLPRGQSRGTRGLAQLTGSPQMRDWIFPTAEVNEWMRGHVTKQRAMVRDLDALNGYTGRILNDWRDNVQGPEGMIMQSKVAFPRGGPDKTARQKVESAWKRWRERQNCLMSEDMDHPEAMRLAERSLFRDGSVLIRKISGVGRFGFSLQLLEAEMLDENYFDRQRGIVAGKELDEWGKVLAYHIFRAHPDGMSGPKERVRIPAEQIIHRFNRFRIGQQTGCPFILAAIERLRQLDRYEDAAVVAARVAACSTVAVSRPESDVADEDGQGGTPAIGTLSPGGSLILPDGYSANILNPMHPTDTYKDFRKGVLQGIGASVGESYNRLGCDLEGVSYSSLREGKLTEWDIWISGQEVAIREQEKPIFEEWLKMALIYDQIPGYSITDFPYLKPAEFVGKRWPWVDPLHDGQATALALQSKLTTVRRVVMEQGIDYDDLLEELKAERAEFEALKIPHPSDDPKLIIAETMAQKPSAGGATK